MRIGLIVLLVASAGQMACDDGDSTAREFELADGALIIDAAAPDANAAGGEGGVGGEGGAGAAGGEGGAGGMGAAGGEGGAGGMGGVDPQIKGCDDAPVEITVDRVDIDAIAVRSGESDDVEIELPDDVIGVSITVVGPANALASVVHLESPEGDVLVDLAPEGVTIGPIDRFLSPFPGPFLSPNRTTTSSNVGGLLAPNNPNVEVTPGTWIFRAGLLNGQNGQPVTGDASAVVFIKRAAEDPGCGKLDVHLFFTGAHGWTAETAPDDPDMQRALERLGAFYGAVGVQIGEVTYDDVPNGEQFRSVEAQPGAGGLGQLMSNNFYETGLAFFFVERFTSPFGDGVIGGIAGGVPGPMMQSGTASSGVAVATELDPSPEAIGHIMGHEGGHFLGLYHTVEQTQHTDQIDDTPPGQAGNWNLMFPTVTAGEARLSPDQGWVIHRNPSIVTP